MIAATTAATTAAPTAIALKAKAGAALDKAKEIKKKVEEAEKKGTNA